MATLRNVMLWVMMVIGVAGCREMMWPVEPGSGGIVIRTITTDVQHGGTFSIEGQNLDRLAGQGRVVFYEGQNIRLPIQLVIGTTLFGCILPDSVRSGRVRVEDGGGSILMDTLLNVYGDSMALNPSLLQSMLWNQRIWMKEGIEPMLVDQSSKCYRWARHPYENHAWIAPHCVGYYRFVRYDSRSGLYHHLSPGMRLERPVIVQTQSGNHTALITRYVRAEGERIRLRSQDHIYERDMQGLGSQYIISLAGMQAGRYTAEVVTDTTADEIGGELTITTPVPEGRGLAYSWIVIRESVAMKLNVTTDYLAGNGERDRDSATRDTVIDIYKEINGCTLDRVSGDTFRFDGIDGEGRWSIQGVLVMKGRMLTANLILQDGADGRARTEAHTLRLKQWPFTQGQDGVVEVGMPSRAINEDEYDCLYSCTKTTQHFSYTEVKSFRTAQPSFVRLRSLEMIIQF